MAYHGGGLEETTDVIARAAAAASGASYYGVVQPESLQRHVPSIRVTRDQSPVLDGFLAHVDVVITDPRLRPAAAVHVAAARRPQP